jgi:hypothetical protein
MKRMIAFLLLSSFCVNSNLKAMSIYNAMSNGVVSFGDIIEQSNFPLVGKLTNLLPFGMIATSCKEYPGQTMLLCAGVLAYILSQNEKVTATFNMYKDAVLERLGIKRGYDVTSDDTLFIFDGDDAEDAEEQADLEDEMLFGDDVDREGDKNQHAPKIKFL